MPASVSKISIHALLAESDAIAANPIFPVRDFYPRSPCGERRIQPQAAVLVAAISIHALLAESDGPRPCGPARIKISIHALLAESDHILKPFKVGVLVFLSTLSLRRATRRCARSRQCAAISIHALLAESDLLLCGIYHYHTQFLSTLSLRRATGNLSRRQRA